MVDHNSYHNQARVPHNHNLLDCAIEKPGRTHNNKHIPGNDSYIFSYDFPLENMDNQFKKGNSILFLNNLSSIIYFSIFWGSVINLCAK